MLGPEGSDGRTSLYFSTRDEQGRSRVAEVDLAVSDDPRPEFRPTPIIDIGPLGAFDDSGATSSCLVEHEERLYQYYTGWTLGRTVPFTLAIGCAISDDGGATWEKASPAPVLGRSAVDPLLTASPWVLVDGDVWRMWYVSASRWELVDGVPKHWYHIRYAEARDGIGWTPSGQVCIDYATADEHAIARPCVVKDGSTYRMWFSARGDAYRLGYAESEDGLAWHRDDARAGVVPSDDGWDAEMIAYPLVESRGGRLVMLYNGNGYGRTGIGWAEQLEER